MASARATTPPTTPLPPPNPGVPAWNDLTDNQRAFAAVSLPLGEVTRGKPASACTPKAIEKLRRTYYSNP